MFTLCQASFKVLDKHLTHSVLITILCGRLYHNSLNQTGIVYKIHHSFVNWTLEHHLYFMNENVEIMRGLATCLRRLVRIMVEPACKLSRVVPELMLVAMCHLGTQWESHIWAVSALLKSVIPVDLRGYVKDQDKHCATHLTTTTWQENVTLPL